jgi:hypothetical protein
MSDTPFIRRENCRGLQGMLRKGGGLILAIIHAETVDEIV